MHLNLYYILLLACAFLNSHCVFAQGEQAAEYEIVKSVRELVKRVDTEQNDSLGNKFAVTQILSKLEAVPTFHSLVMVTITNWEAVVDNWSAIAVDENARLIQEHALLFLPPDQYLNCLTRLLKLYEQGQVSKGELCMMLFRPENDKRWFLSFNYRDPEVLKLLNEVARVFEKDKHIPNLVEFYKSGKAKRRDETLRNEKPQGYYAKEPLPLLLSTIEYEKRANSLKGQLKHSRLLAVIIVLVSGGLLYYFCKKMAVPK